MNIHSRDIYLVRHGHIQKERGKSYVGQKDLPLSREGRAQAEALREALSQVAFTEIVASDLDRTRTTARIIAEKQSARVTTEPALREVSLGRWEGLLFDEVAARYPDEYHRRGLEIADHRPPEGENFRDLARRAVPAFLRIAGDPAGPRAIVTHVGVIRVILCHALGMPLENMFLLHHDYGAFSIIRRKEDRFTLMCHNSRGCAL